MLTPQGSGRARFQDLHTSAVKEAGWQFFQGLDFDGGDLKGDPALAGDVPGLKAFCHREPQCVAFNTNGWLKRSLPPRDSWKRWTDIPQHGLYLKAPP